jgi:preprotein translocase subunit YajC
MAAPQTTGAEGAGGPMGTMMSFLPLIAIVAIFYFLILRPQNKKQKETQKMLSALKKGDRVVTIGGIHGTIQTVRESTVIIRVDDNTKVEFSRSAVSSVESQAKEEKKIEAADENKNDGQEDKKE